MDTKYKTIILQNVLSQPQLRALEDDADALAACPNYWVPREVVEGAAPALTAAEQAVAALWRAAAAPPLAELGEAWQGAEYWCQVYEGGRGLGFHFDKDEHAMAAHGRMATPLLSSVLYLTGSPADPVRQAPTVIIDQRYDHQAGCVLPEHPAWSALVFPARNQYCLFGGAQAHGVLEGMPVYLGEEEEQRQQQSQEKQQQQSQEQPQQQPQGQQRRRLGQQRRVTFLVNWWARRPENVGRATPQDVAAGKLAAARAELAMHPPDTAGGAAAAALEELSLGGAAADASCRQREAGQPPLRRVDFVTVAAPRLEPGDVLPIDGLLQRRHVRVSGGGSSTADAVLVSHPGLSLVPLDEAAVDPRTPLQVLAALLPTADLGSDSEDGGGGGSGSDA